MTIFPKMLKHRFMFNGLASFVWYYGAGQQNYDYKIFDVLELHKSDADKTYINMLASQYKKIVFNKIIFHIKNVIIGWRMEEDCEHEMNYDGKEKRKPFMRGRFFQYSNNACDENEYMKIMKKTGAESESITMATVGSAVTPYNKIMCKNYKGPLPTKFTSVYYPRVSKSVACEAASLPFDKSLGACLNLASPRGRDGKSYYKFYVGFGPCGQFPEKENMTAALEMNVQFEYDVSLYYTCCSRGTTSL